MTGAIVVDRITKRYEKHVAVDGVSFTVPERSIFGLLGPNGAGKTTSIRMILRILVPDEGTVRILDQEPDRDVLDRVGYLPEERGLYAKMKVVDQLAFLAETKGVRRKVSMPRIDAWLKRLGLAEWRERKVAELSKGMQQKIQFIGTVLHEPKILILDEPFSGLDPVNMNLMKDVILDLNRKGTTVVFSAHVMEQVERMCDSICLIDRGKVVVQGRLADVKHRYGTNSVVLAFEGDASFLLQMPTLQKVDLHGSYAEIRVKDGVDPATLLPEFVGRLRVTRFEVVEPTLNSIFIDLVGGPREDGTAAAKIAASGDLLHAGGGAHV